MASRDEIEASTIRPPRRGECRQFAASTTTVVFRAPDDWQNKKVRFEAIGGDFWVQVAPDDAIEIDPDAVDTIEPDGDLTSGNPTIGEKVYAGTYKEFDFFSSDKFVGFISDTSAGLLAVRPAEVALGAQ